MFPRKFPTEFRNLRNQRADSEKINKVVSKFRRAPQFVEAKFPSLFTVGATCPDDLVDDKISAVLIRRTAVENCLSLIRRCSARSGLPQGISVSQSSRLLGIAMFWCEKSSDEFLLRGNHVAMMIQT